MEEIFQLINWIISLLGKYLYSLCYCAAHKRKFSCYFLCCHINNVVMLRYYMKIILTNFSTLTLNHYPIRYVYFALYDNAKLIHYQNVMCAEPFQSLNTN